MPSPFIDDGFTFDAVIPARGGLPEVKIRFRPALSREVYQHQISYNGATTGEDREKAVVTLLQKHLVAWDLLDPRKPDAGTVAIDAHSLRRLRWELKEAIASRILGYVTEEEGDVKNS